MEETVLDDDINFSNIEYSLSFLFQETGKINPVQVKQIGQKSANRLGEISLRPWDVDREPVAEP